MLNAKGGGRVEIARLRNQKLDVEDVVANVAVEPGIIGVPSFALRGYGGAVTGSARFGFQDPANPSFAVKGRADTVQVDRFLSAWSPARGILTGVASTNFDFSGDGVRPEQLQRSLTALGLALLAEGRLGGPVMEAIAQATRTPGLREVRFHDLQAAVPRRARARGHRLGALRRRLGRVAGLGARGLRRRARLRGERDAAARRSRAAAGCRARWRPGCWATSRAACCSTCA